MKSIPKTYRFSRKTIARIEELSETCNPNRTETLEKAIAFIYSLYKSSPESIKPVLQPDRPYFVGGKSAPKLSSVHGATEGEHGE